MKPGVLFDLDGTLLDHRAAASAAIREWVVRQGGLKNTSVDAVAEEWLRLEAVHFAAYLEGRVTFQGQRRLKIAGLLGFLGRPVTDGNALDDMFDSYQELYRARWVAYDDVVPTLGALAARGVPLGVLTNGDEAQQRSKLHTLGLLERLDCVIASSLLPAPKPAVEAFLAGCERLGKPLGSVYYVGDDLHSDALAATRAGLRGVWLNRLLERADVQPEHTIESLRGVQTFFE